MSFVQTKRLEEMSRDERIAHEVGLRYKMRRNSMLEGMKAEHVGIEVRRDRAVTELARLREVDASALGPDARVEHITTLALRENEVASLTEREKHIAQQIKDH